MTGIYAFYLDIAHLLVVLLELIAWLKCKMESTEKKFINF